MGERPTQTDEAVRTVLEGLGVDYRVIPCDPAFADTAAFCERYGYSPDVSANTILVASKKEPKRYAACVVLATRKLDVNGTVRQLLAAGKTSFASAEETMRVTGMMLGGVTPFGLPAAVPLYVDEGVMGTKEVILGGGSRSWKVAIAPQALLRLPSASVVPQLALPAGQERGE